MAGSFDDLIPQQGQAAAPAGFSDLIPGPNQPTGNEWYDPWLNVARGLTLGGGNRAAAAIAHPFDPQARANLQESFDANQRAYQAAHPYAAAANYALGAAGPAYLASLMTGGEAAPLMTQMLRQGTAGALYGAGENAAQGVTDPARAAKNIGMGAAGGVAVAPAGASPLAAQPAKAATAADLKADARAAYKRMEDPNTVYQPQSFNQMLNDSQAAADARGFDPSLHIGTNATLNTMQRFANGGKPLTGSTMQTIRESLGDAAEKGGRDALIAGDVRNVFQNWLSNAGPQDVMSGDAQAVANALKEGNQNWAAASRLGTVDKMIDRASEAAHGPHHTPMATATQGEFSNFLRSRSSPPASQGFNQPEIAAMQDVAHGADAPWLAKAATSIAPHGVGTSVIGAEMASEAPGLVTEPLRTLGKWASLGGTTAAGRIGQAALNRATEGQVNTLAALLASRSPLGQRLAGGALPAAPSALTTLGGTLSPGAQAVLNAAMHPAAPLAATSGAQSMFQVPGYM